MGPHTAPQVFPCLVGETLNAAVSFDGYLDAGETISGTPTVAEVTTTDLAITNKAATSAAETINGLSVAAGRAVTFTVSGQQAGQEYTIKITVTTSAGAVRIGYVTLKVTTA